MSAMAAVPPSAEPPDRRADAIRSEQAYVDWAYEQLDAALAKAVTQENVGIHRNAAYALWNFQQDRIQQIRTALASPKGLVVGRLDLTLTEGETFYIGLHTVNGEGGQPTVVEWQTPLGERFFQATRTFPAGIGRRRTIRMARRDVTGASDETLTPGFALAKALPAVAPVPVPVERHSPLGLEVAPEPEAEPEPVAASEPPSAELLAELSEGDPELTPELEHDETEPQVDELRAADLLLDELARRRTGVLEEVVATIQADQDRLIRAPMEVPLLIQGGPGTGKTIVGLHRAAWVIYQQRQRLIDQSVLVVGPNRRFLDYIGAVLPSLGESDVRQMTIDGLALESLSATDRDRARPQADDPRNVARLKGDPRMATVVRAAVWARVKPRKVAFPYGRFTLRLDADDVDALVGKVWQRGVPYKAARKEMAELVAQALAEEYVRRGGRAAASAGERELRSLMSAARSHLTKTKAVAEMFPPVEPRALVQLLLEDRKLLDRAASVLRPTERQLLHRRPVRRGRAVWTPADLPLLDEAAAQINGPSSVSGHIVVDEAQDLSPMQWRVVARRASQGSMTILGDLGQATSAWSPRTWDEVAKRANIGGKAVSAELRLGYRVPAEVMEFAAPLLELAAPSVRVPRSFRRTGQPVVRFTTPAGAPAVAARLALGRVGRGAVALIAAADQCEALTLLVSAAQAPIPVLTPDGAKGLEFDTVVVVEPAAIAGRTRTGLRQLYIALTRTTKELIVVSSRQLPGGIGGSHRPAVPSTYPNPRGDDPWDNDAVHWLLDQQGGERWTRGVLTECLRRQANQVERNPKRVDEAARFAKRQGVMQVELHRGNSVVVRLIRTDDAAPGYPASEEARRGTLRCQRRRARDRGSPRPAFR